VLERPAIEGAGDQSRRAGNVRVQIEVQTFEDHAPVSVCGAPVDEIRALVQLACGRTGVVGPEIADQMTSLPLLDLPACYICVDQHVRVRHDQAGARPEDKDDAPADRSDALRELRPLRGREEVIEAPRTHEAEDRIIAEVWAEPLLEDLRIVQGGLGREREDGPERALECRAEL
jgi:hypothetical protein